MSFKLIAVLSLLTLISFTSIAQNPSLAVGLETLTMNKGSIDVEKLTAIIMEKQRELKQEALKRFILKLFPETNYTTKFYVQNCLTVLLNERNPKVIEKEVLELTTNYALVLGVAKAFTLKSDLKEVKATYIINRMNLKPYRSNIYKLNYGTQVTATKLATKLIKVDSDITQFIKSKNKDTKRLDKLEHERSMLDGKVKREAIRENANFVEPLPTDSLPFGILVDVAGAALSEIPALRSKGFFRKPINYRQDNFYLNLKSEEEVAFKTSLDTLHLRIKRNTEPYILNYDVMATYLMKLLVSKVEDDIEEEYNEDELREIKYIRSFQDKYPNAKIGLVIAMTSLRETLQDVFRRTPGLKASMVINPSDTFKLKEKYDL